jgi:hypothetical protein
MRKLAEAHQFVEKLGLKGDETAAFERYSFSTLCLRRISFSCSCGIAGTTQ